MKRFAFLTLLMMATVLLVIAFPALAAGPNAPAPPVPAAPAVAAVPALAPAPALPADEHPQIKAAIEAMRNAKHHLESAAHDYDGHRVKSIEHLTQAIQEAETCMSMK